MKLLIENWRRFLKEDEQEYEIYCDMDGVLVDFELGVIEYITTALVEGRAEKLKAKIGRDYITGEDLAGPTKNNDIRKYMYTELQHAADFWENLPWMPNGQKLWAALAPYNPNILTTPMGYGSEIGKQAWIDKNLNPPPQKVFMSKEKYLWANKNSILIDDFTKNTIPWEEHDGIALLYKDSEIEKTLSRLRELGFETN
jgi:hypothetical protein